MKLIPKRLQIETIHGCNASCRMCPLGLGMKTKKKKGLMSLETFKGIVDSLEKYKDNFEMIDLCGMGEPFLDYMIYDRIKYLKKKGFRNIAISTNLEVMTESKQNKILKSGIDTIILSIDGITDDTIKKIRGLSYKKILKNALSIINKRDSGDYNTKFVVRFIEQDINIHEWNKYKKFWLSKINKNKGDLIIKHPIINWGGMIEKNKEKKITRSCKHLYDRLNITKDGDIPLCCIDYFRVEHPIGNVIGKNPIEIFNSRIGKKYRQLDKIKKRDNIKLCKDCNVPYYDILEERF